VVGSYFPYSFRRIRASRKSTEITQTEQAIRLDQKLKAVCKAKEAQMQESGRSDQDPADVKGRC